MLKSLALIFLVGLLLGSLFKKIKLPSLLGMLITGIILSPYALDLLDDSILSISPDLRQLALVIILTRAGLSLNIKELKKVGRPAILLSFIPATLEIAGVTLIAPKLFGISILEAMILGAALSAVSPAVIVPRMLNLINKKYGTNKSIPQMIMASSAVDDIYVIVLFTAIIGIANGGCFTPISIIKIPLSIITGIIVGIVVGFLLTIFYKKVHIRDSAKVIIMLSISFLFITLEKAISGVVPFSGLLSIMSLNAMILNTYEVLAKRLSAKFEKLWVFSEVLLFVLVGATVDMKYAVSSGIAVVLTIVIALFFRVIGVFLCLVKTKLNFKERLFCMLSYLPKGTVQAAIGGIALAMGIPCGKIVLTVAVVSILITAPVGAFGMDMLYNKMLTRDNNYKSK